MAAALKPADLKLLQADPAEFRMAAPINTGDSVAKLGRVMDDWQRKDFDALDPVLQKIAGQPVTAPGPIYYRSYFERGRGHAKTLMAAVICAWLLFASRRPLSGIVASGDRDQARLVRNGVEELTSYLPFLRELLDVQQFKIVNRQTKGEIVILSADVNSSYGLTPDFIWIDEFTHWPLSGEGLWLSLFSAAGKRSKSGCFLGIISNAGTGEGSSWQWFVRESFRQNPAYYFSSLPGPVASWISDQELSEQRQMLPGPYFDRVWGNKWTRGTSSVLAESTINESLDLDGPQLCHQAGFIYTGAIDIGLSHDSAAFVITGKTRCGNAVVNHLVNALEWRPPVGGRISIDAIEQTVKLAQSTYRMRHIVTDPWNAAQLVERLRKQNVPISDRQQSGARLVEQAQSLIEAFQSRAIRLYDFEPLTRDLRRLSIEEKSYGYRLVSKRGPDGHGDVVTALSLALADSKDVIPPGGDPWGGLVTSRHIPVGRTRPIGRSFSSNYRWPSLGGQILDQPNYHQ